MSEPGPVERAIAGKRMIRAFDARPLEPEVLARILDAGRHAASSKNQQRWAFIVIEDRERLGELATIGPWAGHLAGAAAAVALVTPDPHAPDAPLSIVFDIGQAAANMALAAWELGVGSVPATVYEHDRAHRIMGVPDGHHCEYLLSFGYPADAGTMRRPPRAGGRLGLAEVVHGERWGEPWRGTR